MPSDAEEGRLARVAATLPAVVSRYDDVLAAPDAAALLWRRAVADVQAGHLDDRPLYWARLRLRRALRQRGQPLAGEHSSRGFDAAPPSGAATVLLTGFDPFHLDRDIAQSNPAGLAALALHGTTIGTARVRAAILPVRFRDFDEGIVEAALARPFQARPRLAVTVSMGRDQFDLERFPGRRRSARTPDNCNVASGASEHRPLPPPAVAGPEFLEFSLPAAAMTAVDGRWQVRDNRTVRSVERGEVVARSLAELANDTAVCGSGGGFLSNEVAYRALLLQRRLRLSFPLGHIHTPALRGYDSALLGGIVDQLRRLVAAALSA